MEQIVAKLLIYGDLPEDSILIQLSEVYKDYHSGTYSNADLITRCYKQVKRLLVLGTSCAFDKNLWHNYLTYLLIMDENPFSLPCEKMGCASCPIALSRRLPGLTTAPLPLFVQPTSPDNVMVGKKAARAVCM